jgi:hypothetical protein
MATLDIVLLGRLAALIVFLGGVGLGLWEAVDFPEPFDTSFQVRVFLRSVLSAFTSAAIIALTAEIADRLWRRPMSASAAEDEVHPSHATNP